MADMKIEDATLDTQVTGAELLPASDGGTAKAVSAAKIKDYVIGQLADVATESALDTANDGVYVKRGNAVKRVSAGVLAAAVLDYAFALTGIVDINGNEKIALKDSNTKKSATLADLKAWVLAGLADTTGETPVSGAERIAALESAMGNKVDKVGGKGLSTNDFTAADKQKLTGLVSNVQPDWNQTTNTAPDYIKNKPDVGDFANKADRTQIFPEYNSDDYQSYAVGYCVTYEGKFYVAIQDMTSLVNTPDPSSPTYWSEITVGEKINGKVDKEEGMELVPTTIIHNMATVEPNAERNAIVSLKKYGQALPIASDRSVDISEGLSMEVRNNIEDMPSDDEPDFPPGHMILLDYITGVGPYTHNYDLWVNMGDETAAHFRRVEVGAVSPEQYYVQST